MKFINIRGTNGSGKTHLVRSWMTLNKAVPYPRRNNLLGSTTAVGQSLYYLLCDGGLVFGNYGRTCGGIDGVTDLSFHGKGNKPTQEDLEDKLLLYSTMDGIEYILFEGIVVSTIFERWHEFSRAHGGMIWVYLDTPLEICMQRIRARNNNAEINDQLVIDKIASIGSTRRKAIAAGEEVVTLDWKRASSQFRELIQNVVTRRATLSR